MADPLLQVWFHCVVSSDGIPCALASKLRVDALPVRVLAIGVGALDIHPWILYPRLFVSEVGVAAVNIVCAPLNLIQGTEMRTEDGTEVYSPVTAFSGLWVPEALNVAIVYPLSRREDLAIEEKALAKYDLRIVLAEQDLFPTAHRCRSVDEVSLLIQKVKNAAR
jgi:hypothetical protein